jgi:hypothetical protein
LANSTRRTRLLALTVSTAVALLVGELALRVAGVSHPNFYQPDAVRGWGLIPGVEGRWRNEGDAEVAVNADGFRGPARARGAHPGVLRVAVLGDSCAEAIQVAYEQTFVARLETELSSCPTLAGRRIEALDFGVAGYGTAQELLTLRAQAAAFAPDVVLLAFYSGNDVRNNSRVLDADPARPYFRLDGDRLALDDAFRGTSSFRLRSSLPARLLYGVFNHVRLLQLGKNAETAVRTAIGTARARRNEGSGALQELGLDNAVYSPPADANWTDAWRITELLFADLDRESRAFGARLGILSLTTPIQVDPDPAARAAFAAKLGVKDLFYPDDRVEAWGRAHGVPVLALARPLQADVDAHPRSLHGFPNTRPNEGHWNAEGHAAAADRIAPWVCSALAPPK